MIRKHLGRLATILTLGALLGASAFAGLASAANPAWQVSFEKLPPIVKAGNDAGWKVTFTNPGPSNINDQQIIIDSRSTTAGYTYLSDLDVSTGFQETCSTTAGATTCLVGTMPAGGTVVFTVAFEVPAGFGGSDFYLDILVQAGTGNTSSDGPGKSRGDKKPFADSVTVSTNANIDGGFVTPTNPDQTYVTTGNLGRQNRQTSAVDVNDTALPVTIADGGLFTDPTCTGDACTRLIGEWTYLDVPGNDGSIKVTLMIWGGSVAGGVGADDIVLLHVRDDGTTDVIGNSDAEICDSETAPSAIPCIFVTKIGSNYKLVGWLEDNGGLRGGY